jgi:hypothetical protein
VTLHGLYGAQLGPRKGVLPSLLPVCPLPRLSIRSGHASNGRLMSKLDLWNDFRDICEYYGQFEYLGAHILGPSTNWPIGRLVRSTYISYTRSNVLLSCRYRRGVRRIGLFLGIPNSKFGDPVALASLQIAKWPFPTHKGVPPFPGIAYAKGLRFLHSHAYLHPSADSVPRRRGLVWYT